MQIMILSQPYYPFSLSSVQTGSKKNMSLLYTFAFGTLTEFLRAPGEAIGNLDHLLLLPPRAWEAEEEEEER